MEVLELDCISDVEDEVPVLDAVPVLLVLVDVKLVRVEVFVVAEEVEVVRR